MVNKEPTQGSVFGILLKPTPFYPLLIPFKGHEPYKHVKWPESVGLEMVLKLVQSLLPHQLLHSSEIRARPVLLWLMRWSSKATLFQQTQFLGVHRCWGDKKDVNFLSGNYNTILSTLHTICEVNISTAETREKSNANCKPWRLTQNQHGLSPAKETGKTVRCKMLNINFTCTMKKAQFSHIELLRNFSQKVF